MPKRLVMGTKRINPAMPLRAFDVSEKRGLIAKAADFMSPKMVERDAYLKGLLRVNAEAEERKRRVLRGRQNRLGAVRG